MYRWRFISERGGLCRAVTFSAVTVGTTTALLTAYFGYIWYLLYGPSALCMQEYDAPSFSFYSDAHDCIIAVSELGQRLVPIAVLITVPMLLAYVVVIVVVLRRRHRSSGSQDPAEEEVPSGKSNDTSDNHASSGAVHDSLSSEAYIVFWTLTLSIFLPGIAISTYGALSGAGTIPIKEFFGLAIFYGLHLYLAAFLTYCAIRVVCGLARRLKAR